MGFFGLILSLFLQVYIPILEPVVVPAAENQVEFNYTKAIRSDIANEYATGDGVTVAIIDSGLWAEHPQFENLEFTSYSAISDSYDYYDSNGHGTAIAGVLNKVAPDANMLIIKVFGEKATTTWEMVGHSIYYAVLQGAKVINLSLSGLCVTGFEPIKNQIQYAILNDVTVIAAMGNEGNENVYCPASISGVISVGSVDINGNPDGFSNSGYWIDVVAVGNRVWVPFIDRKNIYDLEYIPTRGTSFAVPQVVGLAALLYELVPDITVSEVTDIIRTTAHDISGTDSTTEGFDNKTGYGLIDADAAVQELLKRYKIKFYAFVPIVTKED